MVSVKVTTDNRMKDNQRLVMKLNHLVPDKFARLYMNNVRGITPKKGSGLRRSITKQIVGNQLTIFWRASYAAAQNEGGHTVPRAVSGPNMRDGGFGTIQPRFYRYSRYTTPGTGAGFKEKAFKMTTDQFKEEFYKEHPEYR